MKVTFSIQYAGLQLQIAKNDRGEDVTPLKPISDLFGLRWRQQLKKVTEGGYLPKFLGTCTIHMYGAGVEKRAKNGDISMESTENQTPARYLGSVQTPQKREQTCIFISRVAAFLMSINPDQVRAQGNISGAEFLEQKIEEWADALHDYEEIGFVVNKNHVDAARLELSRINSFTKLIREKRCTESPMDRKAIEAVQSVLAKQIGIPFQPDLTE